MGQEEVRSIPPMLMDKEKTCVYEIAFSKMVFRISPSLFEHIKFCKSAKEICDMLKDLFEGLENLKDTRLKSVVNEYDTFFTYSTEYVASGKNLFRIVVNNLTEHGVTITLVEHNLKLINRLGKGYDNIKSCLQNYGSLKKLTIFQLFSEFQRNESNLAQTIIELSKGPLALISTINPPPMSYVI